jgi:putative ABC transport system permease protein
MTIGAIFVRSNTDAAGFARSYGSADLVIGAGFTYDDQGRRLEPIDVSALAAELVPDGTTSTEILTTNTFVTTTDGQRVTVEATRFDPTSSITDGIIDVSAGRLPTATDEVLLRPGLAAVLGVGVGDTLRLARPDRTFDVVGLGRKIADHDTPLMLFGELDPAEVRYPNIETVIDLPPGTEPAALIDAALNNGVVSPDQVSRLSVRTRDGGWFYGAGSDDPTTQQLAWGWVAGVLALTAAGIIIAAAFATSARRQLATVGQLAANGASPGLIRRTLSLQGTWSGAIGAAIGVLLGVGLFLLGRPLIERLAGRSWTVTTIRPTDLLVLFATGVIAATLAALLPARSLATTSVLSALAGRRPIRPVNPRTVIVGVVSFVSGLFLLAVATAGGSNGNDGNLFALVAVIGGLAILVGMCLGAPLAVSASTAVAARLGPSWRLSGRSLHRTRWRSAAVVTAIAVAGAFAVAAATVATGLDSQYPNDYETTEIARNEALVRTDNGAEVTTIAPGVLADVRAVMDNSAESLEYGIDLPGLDDEQLFAASQAAEAATPSGEATPAFLTSADVTIVDDEYLDAMGLSGADRDSLKRTGALSLFPLGSVDGPSYAQTQNPPIRLLGADREVVIRASVLQDGLRNRNGATQVLMTRQGAKAAGLDVIPVGIRFTSDNDLTSGQRRALDDVRFGGSNYEDAWIVGDESPEFPPNVSGRIGYWITYQWVDNQPSSTLVQAGIVAATLLLVLVVVVIGLSLAAVESRDERNTLIAVGASPATLRRRSATTATLLATTGGILAVPSGLLPILVVQQSQEYPSSLEVPWPTIAAVVVVVPLLVGAIAFVGSSLNQRLRPPRVVQTSTE